MRRPWEITAGAPDDVESLQTDVMRFVAILGLCLTAIFSLVNAAREEGDAQSAVVEIAQESQLPEAGMALVAPPATVEPAPPATASTEPIAAATAVPDAAPRDEGFSLEFASARALAALRESGDVAVYAIVGDDYWLLEAGDFPRRSAAPASYYRMHADTLPAAMDRVARTLPQGAQVTWAVTLPAAVAGDIEQIMSRAQGGALVIGADGSVALEGGE